MATNKVLTQFKQMFARFCNDPHYASYGKWSCGNGGYDQWFEIYYNGTAVCDCVKGRCEWYGDNRMIGLSDADVEAIKDYITAHYERTSFVDRHKITHREWELLDKLTSKAKMDWFFDETTKQKKIKNRKEVEYEYKGYITSGQASDASCAFLAENFWGFLRSELEEIKDCFIKCGVEADSLDPELERWDNNEVGEADAEVM